MIDMTYFEKFVTTSTLGSFDVTDIDITRCRDFISHMLKLSTEEEKRSTKIIILAIIANSIETKNYSFEKFDEAFVKHYNLRMWITEL